MNKVCQSCAMPLKKDPEGGGNNADESISTQYCSHCFKSGKFRAPDIIASEMRVFVKNKMEDMGFSAFLARWFTRGMPKLERWAEH